MQLKTVGWCLRLSREGWYSFLLLRKGWCCSLLLAFREILFILLWRSSEVGNFILNKHSSQADIALILNEFKKRVYIYPVPQWRSKYLLSQLKNIHEDSNIREHPLCCGLVSLMWKGKRANTLERSWVRSVSNVPIPSACTTQVVYLPRIGFGGFQTCLCHFYLFF